MAHQGQPAATTVIVQQPVGKNPVQMTCPACHQTVLTSTRHAAGLMTVTACIFLCMCSCYACCLVPFCIPGCKDTIHTCPNCKTVVGKFDSMKL